MSRINSNSLSSIVSSVTGRTSEAAPPRTLSSVTSSPLAQALPKPASQFQASLGHSSFEPSVGILPRLPGSGGVAGDIRQRLSQVQQRIPGYQAHADQIASQLSPQERQLLMNAPPELRPQLQAQIQQQHQALAQQLRGSASSINSPFTPAQTNGQMAEATQKLAATVNKTFDTYARQLDRIPMPLAERARLQKDLDARRSMALQEVGNNTALMARQGASFQDVMGGKQRIEQSLDLLTRDLNSNVLNRLPPEHRAQAQAELEMARMDQAQALHNHFSRALQPASPTDFNQLPGGAPAMSGPLSQTQAKSVLSRLESGIQGQYQARLQEANKLPPEMRAQATFDAQVQRDRMLVSAYRNVLSRVSQPVHPPIGFPTTR